MLTRFGNAIYLIGCIFAVPCALICLLAFYRIVINQEDRFVDFALQLTAITVLVWGCGWIIRYVLSGSKSIKPKL
jgi:hypothetical protein